MLHQVEQAGNELRSSQTAGGAWKERHRALHVEHVFRRAVHAASAKLGVEPVILRCFHQAREVARVPSASRSTATGSGGSRRGAGSAGGAGGSAGGSAGARPAARRQLCRSHSLRRTVGEHECRLRLARRGCTFRCGSQRLRLCRSHSLRRTVGHDEIRLLAGQRRTQYRPLNLQSPAPAAPLPLNALLILIHELADLKL